MLVPSFFADRIATDAETGGGVVELASEAAHSSVRAFRSGTGMSPFLEKRASAR
jgi:hypothetical protein